MHRRFGLTRDPFQAVYDAELYWESRQRRQLRRQATDILTHENNLWIEGAPGAGRSAFAHHLFGELVAAQTPVLAAPGAEPQTGPELLRLLSTQLLSHAPLPQAADPLDEVETFYAALVQLWEKVGTLPLLIADGRVGEGALQELQMLAELRLFGHPLVSVVLIGEGDPPPQWARSMERVSLPSFSAEEQGKLLRHRLLMCGAPDALAAPDIASLVADTPGVESLLGAARAALARRALEPNQPVREEPANGLSGTGETSAPSIFSPDDLGAVSDLLDAIGSDPTDD